MGGVDGNSDTTAPDSTARIARAAWFCAFVLPLILAALLLGVKSAQAASPPPGVVPFAFEEELELEAEASEEEDAEETEAEFAEAECEIAEEEAAEGEIGDAEAKEVCKEAEEFVREAKAGNSSSAAAQCPIRSGSAHAATHRGRLKLTIGYTSSTPTPATIEIRSGGRRIASVHRKLGKSGVLRITRKLGSKRIKRVTVSFKSPSCGTPRTKSTKVH
jgi:hypothetical protein